MIHFFEVAFLHMEICSYLYWGFLPTFFVEISGVIVHNICGCQSSATLDIFRCDGISAVLNSYPAFPPMPSPTQALYHPMLGCTLILDFFAHTQDFNGCSY